MSHEEEQLRVWRLINYIPEAPRRIELHEKQLKIEKARVELNKEEAKFLEEVNAELKKMKKPKKK